MPGPLSETDNAIPAAVRSPATSIRTPAGVWRNALSIRLAIICARSSLSPASGSKTSRRVTSVLPCPGGRGERLGNLARYFCKVQRSKRRPPRAGLDLADAEQGVEGMEHPLDVADRVADRVAPCAGGQVGARGFETTQHPSKGLAEIVCDVGADLLVCLQELFDAIEQTVEGPCEGGHVVICAAQRNSPAPIAIHKAARGLPHRSNAGPGTERSTTIRRSSRARGWPRSGPTECREHTFQEGIRAPLLVSDDEDRAVVKLCGERAYDLRLGFSRLFAAVFLRLRPALGVGAPCRNAQVSGDLPAIRANEAIGEASAAGTARFDDAGEAFAAARRRSRSSGRRFPRQCVRRNR